MPLDRRLRDDLHRAAESIEPDTEGGLERVTRRAGSRSTGSVVMVAVAAMVVIVVFVTVIMPGRRPDGSVPGGADGIGSPGPTVRDATSILGSWAVTLTDGDPGVASLGMAGEWSMRLGAGSTIDLIPPAGFRPPSGQAPDRYVHAENGTTFLTTLFVRDFAESCTGSGTYTWSVANGHMSLAAVDDTCDARRALLATRSWSSMDAP
jgi:hypothetical protein